MTQQKVDPEWLLEQRRWRTDKYGILRWAIALQLKNEKGQLLEWKDRRFLIEPLCDMHPLQVTVKCSQVGLSTVNILKSAFCAQILGYGVIYTLPTDSLLEEFAATKVNLLYQQNPQIRPTEADSQGKRIYNPGFVLYKGTFGERQQISISADLVVSDETDRSNLAVVEGLNSRLDASKYKGRWRFTNPTRPNVGTDLLWQQSDQRKWHITCPSCGEEQVLDFWVNIDRERRVYVCRKCKGELPDDARRMGKWKPTAEGRWHGYHINQLMAAWISADDLMIAEAEESMEQFFNFRLGLPVVGGGLSVDPDLIMRSQVYPMPDGLSPRRKFMGVDVGAGLHVMIGNEFGPTKITYLTDMEKKDDRWDQLSALFVQEGINICVIDNAPTEQQTAFQAKHGRHRVLRCIYDYHAKRKEHWEVDSDRGVVLAHRTRVIDDTIAAYGEGKMPVYLSLHDPWLNGTGKRGMENCLTKHWGTLYVVGADGQDTNVVKKDRMGNVIRTWENAGPDHFAHANVYYFLAREIGKNHLLNSTGWIAGGFPQKRQPRGEDDRDEDDRVKGPSFFSI